MKKLYTVAEANRTLPYVRSIVTEIRERYAAIQELGRQHNGLKRVDAAERADLKSRIQADARSIRACMEELEQIGAELKDYERGLVDFPAELDGRDILLCWMMDEAEIGHWHEANEGFPGRQPVPAHEPDWPEVNAAPAGRD